MTSGLLLNKNGCAQVVGVVWSYKMDLHYRVKKKENIMSSRWTSLPVEMAIFRWHAKQSKDAKMIASATKINISIV